MLASPSLRDACDDARKDWHETVEPPGALLRSFLSLVSFARKLDGSKPIPFLQTQVQIWLRALSRVQRVVSAQPEFIWGDDGVQAGTGLPGVYCRECGYSGWLAVQSAQDPNSYKTDYRNALDSYFEKKRRVRYLFPAADPAEALWLTFSPGASEATVSVNPPGPETHAIAIRDPDLTSFQSREGNDLRRCPNCESNLSMAIVGSAGASLSSVAVSHLYASPFNEDKKLLAFTDSVQDASHRAGFFMGRTYRFNLRAAIQAVLEARGDVSLDRFSTEFHRFWIAKFADEETQGTTVKARKSFKAKEEEHSRQSVLAGQQFVASFLPPDLMGLKEYIQFIERNQKARDAIGFTKQRLSWEVALEFGLNLKVGRTLDKVRCSTLWFPEETLQRGFRQIDSFLSERHVLWPQLDPGRRHHFIRGILMRAKRRGGILDPLLASYVENNGTRYSLSRTKLMSPFSQETPKPSLLADCSSHSEFDAVRSEGSGLTWHGDWIARCFDGTIDRSTANDLYSDLLRAAAESGLLEGHEVNHKIVYGLSPSAMVLTANVGFVRAHDGDDVTLPRWEIEAWLGMPSLSYRGKGVYEKDEGRSQSYYRQIYRRGTVRRIQAHEHTGLLGRTERNKVERGFREAEFAHSPNLLTCTPTLEMGIDVGDLSTTMVCSIPPTPSNYLQRIGRAGRKTGNALILALATPQPHDLYYYADPEQMLSGNVMPPGCFLDAPEMLKRQFAAFCLDQWTSNGVNNVPSSFSGMIASGSLFPQRFLTETESFQRVLLSQFIGLFRSQLADESQVRLKKWVQEGKLRESFEAAVESAHADLREFRAAVDRLEHRQKLLENEIAVHRVSVETGKVESNEILSEIRLLRKRIGAINRKYPIGLFVEKGVLPNYDLPEDGVQLQAVITDVEGKGPGGETGTVFTEILRAAAPALREFAPKANFYYNMRKLPIDKIDTGGSQRSQIESWRICESCGHSVLESLNQSMAQCPRCASANWPDAGQKIDLLRHRKAESRVSDSQSRSLDEFDDRDTTPYDTLLLFDIPQNGPQGGYLNAPAAFGFEYLQNITAREINFGERGMGQFSVAGKAVSSLGFRVCRDCGVVHPGVDQEVRHRKGCRKQADPVATAFTTVRLYRELESEAIRFLLPVSTFMSERRIANLKSSIELGIRTKFGGKAAHLRLASMTLPSMSAEAGARNYLVLYDSVIGGTGYLKEFVKRPDSMRQVFQQALSVLQACECQTNPRADGCYRCIYAYQNQRDMDKLSRVESIGILNEILGAWDGLIEVEGLGNIDVGDSLLESELEQRFFRYLRDSADEFIGEAGSPSGSEIRFGQCWWRIRLQPILGQADGVEVASSPDCVLYPLSGVQSSVRPIAIFLDGFKYHARPNKQASRLIDDLRKREAILRSEKYRVFVLTHWDFEALEAPPVSFRIGPLEIGEAQWNQVSAGMGLDKDVLRQPALNLLKSQLARPVEPNLAEVINVGLATWIHHQPTSSETIGVSHDLVLTGVRPPQNEGTGAFARQYEQNQFLQVLGSFTLDQGKPKTLISVWLADEFVDRSSAGYRECWQSFWHIWNLANALPGFKCAIGLVAQHEHAASAIDLVHIAVKALFEKGCAAQLGEYSVGFELVDDTNEVIAMAEVAWPGRKIALVLDITAEDFVKFVEAGWRVFGPSSPLESFSQDSSHAHDLA